MGKEKATIEDLYDVLSYHVWKKGLEIIEELEESGKKAGHFRGVMYVHFSRWEEEGFIESREAEMTEWEKEHIGLPRREYHKISAGSPFDNKSTAGDLEKSLVPT